MQLPKQFKSWVQFYKYAFNPTIQDWMSDQEKIYKRVYVAEMALKELLTVMPDEHIDMVKMYRNTMGLSPEEKLFNNLIDILY